MDFGDWIGALLLIGSILVGAFSKKKESDKDDSSSTTRRNQRQPDHRSRIASAMPSLYALMTEDEEEDEVFAPAKTFHYTETPPPVPTSRQELSPQQQGERATIDTPVPEQEMPSQQPASSGLNLHDKDALRRAIILSDILPPKF